MEDVETDQPEQGEVYQNKRELQFRHFTFRLLVTIMDVIIATINYAYCKQCPEYELMISNEFSICRN